MQLKKKLATCIGVVGATTTLGVTQVFAAGDTATAMTTALNTVQSDALAALAAVAPIGVGIAGAFMVWKFGMRFFKSLAK